MIEAHFKKLRIRDDVSAEEESAIRAMISGVQEHPADKVVIRRGQEISESLLLLDGWIARTKDLADGQRQISELQFAGDFTDLHGFTLKRLDHNVATMARWCISTDRNFIAKISPWAPLLQQQRAS